MSKPTREEVKARKAVIEVLLRHAQAREAKGLKWELRLLDDWLLKDAEIQNLENELKVERRGD